MDGAKTPLIFPHLRWRTQLAATAVAFPAALFYIMLFRLSMNLPLGDDYDALLNFLNHATTLHGVGARASYFLGAQFNEYKLFLGHSVGWLQFVLLGHVDLRILCAIGDASVLLLAVVLWKMFLPRHKDLGDRLMLFIPVSWLLFQLQYAETLNCAMPGLQNLPVLVFSFAAILLLARPSARSFAGAVGCLVLSICASGNGIFLVPIGLLMLAIDRRYAGIAIWLLVTMGCMAAYAYHYNVYSSQARTNQSILTVATHFRPLYVLAFMGNAASVIPEGHVPQFELPASLILGGILCVFGVVLWRRRYFRRNPLIGHCFLFLLLTSVGVAGLRSEIGIGQSLAARYAIYSLLFLIFAWFAFVEEFLLNFRSPFRRNRVLMATGIGVIVFALIMDQRGALFLQWRDATIVTGMEAFERPGSTQGPILPVEAQGARAEKEATDARLILQRSIELGIYQPPRLLPTQRN